MGGVEEERQRLFIAVPLPDKLRGFVGRAQQLLPQMAGLRLLRADQLHVTLAFIGEVGEDKAAAARALVDSVPDDMGGEGLISRFLLLPSASKTRVVTLEVMDGEGVLASLFARIMGGLETAGVMEREKRPFRPHLTVARLRVPGPVQPRSESGQARFAVESVCLYKSELKREGAAYAVLARTVFGRRESEETA
jgi:RNA 2',3'-cyclic 3'-phosphodiesterase